MGDWPLIPNYGGNEEGILACSTCLSKQQTKRMVDYFSSSSAFEVSGASLVCKKSGDYTFRCGCSQTYSSTGGLYINGEIKVQIPGNASGFLGQEHIFHLDTDDVITVSVTDQTSEERFALFTVQILS